ncbi:hypothetical protein F8M41_025604 [Gigaspora margarita]|uniref:BED-type domain-containing protein n=1 Tax=Gigaspora margarita TaxID=4874 RepID=A0A8H4ABK0_GIGMA|nr:hypothetical protein F8M41_025604 [Gigaspora margarita]
MKNTHEIRNYFHTNALKTKLVCDICEASYRINTNISNLKKHFAKYHRHTYQEILRKNKERKKQIKEINQIQRQKKEKERIINKNINNKNKLATQNNETSIIQIPKPVQIEDYNSDDYTTEEEIIKIVENGKTLPLVQNTKRKIIDKEKIFKKQKSNSIILNTKDSIIDLNIQNKISLQISGKCTLNFD